MVRKLDTLVDKHQRGLINLTQAEKDKQQPETPEKSQKAEFYDPWADNTKKAEPLRTSKQGRLAVPNILNPKSGHSYNPTQDSHKALLTSIVVVDDKLEDKYYEKVYHEKKNLDSRIFVPKAPKPKSKKEALQIAEHSKIKEAKAKKVMEYHFQKYIKDHKKDKTNHGMYFLLIQK